MKNTLKYLSSLLITTTSLLMFYPQSNATDSCLQESSVTKDSLILIFDNIYLSKDGKIYEKIDCPVYRNIASSSYDSQVSIQNNSNSAAAVGTGNLVIQDTTQVSDQTQLGVDGYGYGYGYDAPNTQTSIQNNSNEAAAIGEYNTIVQDADQDNTNMSDDDDEPEPIEKETEPTEPINKSTHHHLNSLQQPQTIEISPVYDSKFIEIDRKLTIEELIRLKKHLLKEIDDKLSAKYTSNYSLIENNDSILKAKIENINRVITNNTWETLELTITPSIVSSQRIDMVVSAILYVQSGVRVSVPPPKSGFKVSNNYLALEDYIGKLIVYLKKEIPFSEFTLKNN